VAAKKSPARIASIGIGIALIGVAGFLLFTYSPPEPVAPPPVVRPAKLMTLETLGDASERRYTGKAKATRLVDLSFRVAGPLIEFDMNDGQTVEKGELLGRIDPRDFTVRLRSIDAQLDEARSVLTKMQTGARKEDIVKLESEVQRTAAELKRADNDYERYRKALETNAVSKSDVDRMYQMKARAAALLATAQENLKIGQVGARQEDIDAQEAKIRTLGASRDAASDELEYTYLKAPFAGRIARTYVENFQDVKAKERVLSLQDVSRVEIVVDIPESVAAIADQNRVERYVAVFDSLAGREFEVAFQEVEIEADSRTQTYAATFVMDAPSDVRILPGMSATVRIELKTDAHLIRELWWVPADAVFSKDGEEVFAWRVKSDMTVERIKVVTGDVKDVRILITEGLDSGDTIVTAGVHQLVPGQKVRKLETTTK